MFKCKVCAEKDQRISDLKEQIAHLRQQIALPSNDPETVPALALEADAIMSGHQHVIEIKDTELPEDDSDAEQLERDRILSANY